MSGLFTLLLVCLNPVISGKMTLELTRIIKDTPPNKKIFVIVHMNTKYPYEHIQNLNLQEKCQIFKDVAEHSQKAVINYLKILPENKAEIVRQFWIFNGFHLKATRDVIEELASRDDVWFICHNGTVQLNYEKVENIEKRTPEWNIIKIMADSCWAAGYSGNGIVIGHIDTGVLTTHEALAGKWLSPYWYDAVGGQPSPYDDNGHGTHTVGIICGGDGYGPFVNDVGVAYGARFIPTKAFDAGGSGQYAWIDACMQYLADLKSQGINIRAINNSWGSSNGSDLHWWDIVLNWKNLGILPVFSAGGNGPGYGTINSPASYPTAAAVTATNSNDSTWWFAHGPAPNIPPINNPLYWYYPGWNLLKPDFSAPGVNIRSCDNNGGYATRNGTSYSAPHVSGGVAILLEKNPNLSPQEVYNILKDNCTQPSQGGPYPNNTYGWGRINLWHALKEVPPTNAPFIVLIRTQVVNDNNGNGKLDPGEEAGIVTYVKNTGGLTATNVQGRLRTTSPYINVNDSISVYGTINSGDSTNNLSNPYHINVSATTPPGHKANFQLILTSAESTWTRNFSLYVGIAPGMIIWGPKFLPNFPTNHSVNGVGFDKIGDRIYVLDSYSYSIYCYSSDSFVTYYGSITGPASGLVDITYSQHDDAFFVCASNPKTVWKINKSTGGILRQFDNPANDYPVGLALCPPNTMWYADRRTALGGIQLIYIGDTLGNAVQYISPVQGYYNTRCLAYDSLGNSFVNVQTWFNSGGNILDSTGVVEMTGPPPTLTGRRFLLDSRWQIRGIEFDPRDGNYWITIIFNDGARNQIAKVKGFYTPLVSVRESDRNNLPADISLKIIPNPANDFVTFYINAHNSKNNYLNIYDASGRLMAKIKTKKGENIIKWRPKEENRLAKGVYFVIFKKDENNIVTRKFVLIH
ncbi:MAG: S8 family serine peptidase [candidate division WOR-3 bacterium]